LPTFPTVSILGVNIHALTTAQALQWMEAAMQDRAPRQICTANPEFVMAAQQDANFRALLNTADLVLPDGVGLLWAARQLGQHLPERVAGVDMVYHLAEVAAHHGWRIYFLGAQEGVAARAADKLHTQYPGLRVAGTFAGSPRPEDEADIVARLQAAQPDILWVAYGAPAQDKWIARNILAHRLSIPVSMGVGGAFDFVAGVAHRAPVWMQRLGLEWLHRLLRQPWRWRRILTATAAFPLAVWAVKRRGLKNTHP
jgi:N-acetylglucosaminyldiphosphoundecaprenol N-acetyl-beta-D-mannosaminyltransferase